MATDAGAMRPDSLQAVDEAVREDQRLARRRYRRHRRIMLLVVLVVSALLGGAMYRYCFELVTVRGASMSPTLENGDVVLCVRQSLLDRLGGIVPEQKRRVTRDDLVLIRYAPQPAADGGEVPLMIKRAIAMGGDTIDTGGGEMIVNQSTVAGHLGESDRVYPITVPTGQMFVVGDARAASIDSRQRAFGLVPEADVIARPVAVLWPAFDIGLVK